MNGERNPKHTFDLGEVVRVKWRPALSVPELQNDIDTTFPCNLFVVGFSRDCDGTPLYHLSDIPVAYPTDAPMFSSAKATYALLTRVSELNVALSEEDRTGRRAKRFCASPMEYLFPENAL